MSITATPVTKPIMFARNPVLMSLLSTDGGDPYAAQGVKATLSAGAKFPNGETVTWTYTEPDGTTEAVTFTASAAYTAEDEIPDDSYAGTNLQYITLLQQKIQAHPRIAPFFTVTKTGPLGGYTISLQAKSTLAGWDVVVTNSAGFTELHTDASGDTTPENYRVLVEVYFEKTYLVGDWVLAAQMEGRPDANGRTYYDLSSILEAQCKAWRSEPQVPEFGTDAPAVADNLRRYYVRYTEEYGNPIEAQDWAYDQVRYVLDGGLSQELWTEYYTGLSLGFFDSRDETNNLLTWMPDGKHIGASAPEYLPWYNHTGETTTAVLEVVRHNVDTGVAGSPAYAYTSSPVSALQYETVLFPISADILEAVDGITIGADDYKYVVRVVDATSDWEGGDPVYLSPERTYYLDRLYYESERYLQYLSGFGCPEVWRCTGELDKRLKVDRSAGTKSLQPGYNAFATERFQYARTFEQSLVYRTGYLTRGQADVLQELLLAGEVYDVSASGYIPLLITSEDFDVSSTRDDLLSYQFNAAARLNMRNYSKRTISETISGDWQEVGGESWFDTFIIPWTQPE